MRKLIGPFVIIFHQLVFFFSDGYHFSDLLVHSVAFLVCLICIYLQYVCEFANRNCCN